MWCTTNPSTILGNEVLFQLKTLPPTTPNHQNLTLVSTIVLIITKNEFVAKQQVF
jgi:hypothetical protein